MGVWEKKTEVLSIILCVGGCPKMGHTGIPKKIAMFIEDNDDNDENGPIFR
jgi:hypothetical protein